MTDSFKTRTELKVGAKSYDIWSLAALPKDKVVRLPYSLKILLENLLRFEDGVNVTRKDVEALLDWNAKSSPEHEISFTPARVIMQDFTGVPCVVDLAAMREAIRKLGGDPERVNPLAPAEMVIDHSVMAIITAPPTRSPKTPKSNSNATANATPSCAGARRPSATSRSCRPTPASFTK